MAVDISNITREEAAGRARDLVPVLAERAEATERSRRLPDETLADFLRSGLLRLSQPKVWGGPELAPSVHIDVMAELGRACGSSAWTYGIYASHFWQLALYGEQAQRDVWAENPEALMCTSTVGGPPPQRVSDGVHIREGFWKFVSGVHHADWIAVNAPLIPPEGTGHPDLQFLLVPRSDIHIIDDWYSTSLAGSDSCTVMLRDVFVPEHRMLGFSSMVEGTTPGAALHSSALYRLPLSSFWPMFLAAPALGIARGAAEAWAARTREKLHAYTRQPVVDNPVNHVKLGRAGARIDAADVLLHRAVDGLLAETEDQGEASMGTRVRNRRDFGFAAALCAEAVEEIFLASGASSLATSSPIARAWRDVHGVAQHAMLNLDSSLAGWGRLELGIGDGREF